MKRLRWFVAVLAAAAAWPFAQNAHAGETKCARLTRENVIACALASSPSVRAQEYAAHASDARREAASPWLPANPVASVSVGRRAPSTLYTSATLAQEVAIAGQRGARIDVASAEHVGEEYRLVVARRRVASDAWLAYFDVLAAEEELRLASALESTGRRLVEAVTERADKGLVPPVDADLADAAALRMMRMRLAAERRTRAARADLATRVGIDPSLPVAVEGQLEPLPAVDALARTALGAGRTATPPAVAALEAEQRAASARAVLYRRMRVPNLTFSAFTESKGPDEQVLALGVSLPIPLPQPLGRTFSGEIAESEALAERARAEADGLRRARRLALVTSLGAYDSRRTERDAFTPERMRRAEQTLATLAAETEAGRLAIREAVLLQQQLIELLHAGLEARHMLCIASVELARAAEAPLEGGMR